MHRKHNQVRRGHDAVAERAVVLQLLREDRPASWSVSELQRELVDLVPTAIAGAIDRLLVSGVVTITGEVVRVSPAVRHLDRLEMISI